MKYITPKDQMIEDLLYNVINNAECECDDGKGCALCWALILIKKHDDWVFNSDGTRLHSMASVREAKKAIATIRDKRKVGTNETTKTKNS